MNNNVFTNVFIVLVIFARLAFFSFPLHIIDAKNKPLHSLFFNKALSINGELTNEKYQNNNNVCFQKGEKLYFEVGYGFLDLGQGYSEIKETEKMLDGKSFYHAEIKGWTKGMMSWFAKVNNTWGAVFDKKKFFPIKNYRKVRENSYRLQEVIDFDSVKKEVTSRYRKKDDEVYKVKGVYPFKDGKHPLGLITGFIHLRNIDFETKMWGDTIHVPGFIEDKMYDLKLIYKGKDIVNTDFGKVNCFLITPVLPENSIFTGNNAVKAWISADNNKIPIHFQARLFVGNVKLTLSKYEKLKHPFNALLSQK